MEREREFIPTKRKNYIYINMFICACIYVHVDTHNTHTLSYSPGRKSLCGQCKCLKLFENHLKVKKEHKIVAMF